MEEITLIPIKITKNNITKYIFEEFEKKIDKEKPYSLKELKDILSESYKDIKDKKKNNVKKLPSKYNIFIKEEIVKLKAENNENLNNKDILKQAASNWKKQKNI
tara:strand:- start:1278 stop:1589 length:312 start_codon:yes stop_codon:yes gene_type:complete